MLPSVDPLARATSDDRSVVRIWQQGRKAWPQIDLPLHVFTRWTQARSSGDAPSLHAADAFLACACLEHVPEALEAFTRTYEPVLFAYAFRVARRRDASRDLAQELLVRLLYGDDTRAPKLAEYAGRGSLRGWLRIVTTRRALNARRDARRREVLEGGIELGASRAQDPEHGFLRALYAPQVRTALLDALAVLSRPERELLRHRYCEGLGLDAIAAPHGWSKPTACRRIAAARERARQELVARLRDVLGVTAVEVEGVLGLVVDTLELDLSSVLRVSA